MCVWVKSFWYKKLLQLIIVKSKWHEGMDKLKKFCYIASRSFKECLNEGTKVWFYYNLKSAFILYLKSLHN